MSKYMTLEKAAVMLNYKPSTLRYRLTGTGPYKHRNQITDIGFTTGGKSIMVLRADVEKRLRSFSN